MKKNHFPIGMFDSGVGGLTVMRQLIQFLPGEEIVYFADTARFPYGNQAPQSVCRYSQENAAFLVRQGIKALVMACNTSSAHAFHSLEKTLSIPVIDVIGPGAAKAAVKTRSGHIAVLGTASTIASKAYQKAIMAIDPAIRVTSIACPLFAPLVEESFINHPATELIAEEYLAQLRTSDVDTILLGCTHYPLLEEIIQKSAGPGTLIVDSAVACAQEVYRVLKAHELLNESQNEDKIHRYFVSADPDKFQKQAATFLKAAPQKISLAEDISETND